MTRRKRALPAERDPTAGALSLPGQVRRLLSDHRPPPVPLGVHALHDGRRLAYAEYGDPDGAPVLLFHGWPGSRVIGAFYDAPARRRRLRLIAPDRPGIGRSDYQPERCLLDWAADVTDLADGLGLDDYAVVGFSGGAPYAAACAHRHAERIRALALVSGLGPGDSASLRRGLPLHVRSIFALAARRRALGMLPTATMGYGLRRTPWIFAGQAWLGAPPADRAVLEQPRHFSVYRAEQEEAFRQGARGLAHDLSLYGRPWGFALEDLTLPVLLIHGEQDRNVPVVTAREVARRLPRCEARFLPEAGHLWLVEHFGVVADALSR